MKAIIAIASLSWALLAPSALAEKCTKDEAKAAVEKACESITAKGKGALGELQKFRFCGDNYVWVQDTSSDVKMIMHPIKVKMSGKALKDQTDDNKKQIFVEFDKMAKSSPAGGWVDYVWPKPGSDKAVAKSSFVKLCPGDLSWVAGAGVYID